MNNPSHKINETNGKKAKGRSLVDSEETYRKLYEGAPIAYFSIGEDKIIKNCNNASTNLLGFTKAELLEKTIFDLYADTPEGLSKAKEIFKQFIKGKMILNEELQMKRKNGEVIWISLTVNPIINEKGNIVESRSMVVNITERKNAERKLIESEKKYYELFNKIYSSVAVYEAIDDGNDFIFKDFNLAAEKVENIKKEDLIGKSVVKMFPGVKKFGLFDVFQRVWKTGVPEHHPISIYRDERIYGWRENYVYKLPTGEIVAVYEDITDEKLKEIRLTESEEKYRSAYNRSNLYKDIFTHDINNILQNILSSLELSKFYSQSNDKNKEFEEVTSLINEQVIRGKELVKNVQNLSQVEEGKNGIYPIEALRVIKKTSEALKESFPDKNIKIEINSSLNEYFVGTNKLLKNIFENILYNAVYHNENNIINITVNVSKISKNNANYIRFEVLDNGLGIPDSMKGNIFSREYKEGEIPTGIGLGLLLVKRIIEKYNGEISVEDRIIGDHHQGSKFIILIPERQPNN